MDDELTPEQKFASEDGAVIVARGLLVGRDRQRLVEDLRALDWTPAAARRLIDRVEQDLARFRGSDEAWRQILREANRDVAVGLALLLGAVLLVGLIIFFMAFLGVFVIFLCAAPFVPGAFLFMRGWSRRQTYHYLLRALEQTPTSDDGSSTGRAN